VQRDTYMGDISKLKEDEAEVARKFLNHELPRVRDWATYEKMTPHERQLNSAPCWTGIKTNSVSLLQPLQLQSRRELLTPEFIAQLNCGWHHASGQIP
jgi:hypothetical protein